MPEKVPLYTDPFRIARYNGEVSEWRESLKANSACRDGMDKMVRERFNGMHLDGDCAKDLCDEYGVDRVGWVLASTIQHRDWDGRFRPRNHEWAGTVPIPTAPEDHSSEYVLNSHSEILNGLTDQYREYVQSLGLNENDIFSRDGLGMGGME